jgi:hypothetical protein
MYQPKIRLQDFLGGQEIRFECQHKEIFYKCRFKIDGHWERAKICLDTGRVLIGGEEVRRCNVC